MNAHQKNLIDLSNQPGNLLVITNYPPRGEGVHTAKIGGVAGFTKNTLIPLAHKYALDGRSIIILADIIDKPTVYEEDGMLVVRCWQRNSLKLYSQILNQVMQYNAVRDILIEFEFSSYGDFLVTSLFPVLVLYLRLIGKRTSLVLHQVVIDLWSLLGHVGINEKSMRYQVFSTLLPAFYFSLTHLADQTIVLEEVFRKRLKGIAPMDRVSVIPHGVEEPTNVPSKHVSRTILGIKDDELVLLSFGFITWYKGTDLLISALSRINNINGKRVRLIVAGGPSTSQKHKLHYQSYYQSVLDLTKNKPNVTITGFVPTNKLGIYFSAADIVMFPYRTMMSSSGPLSLALSYKKPILLSSAMSGYFETIGVSVSATQASVKDDDIILPIDMKKLPVILSRVMKRPTLKRLANFSELLAENRVFARIASTYYTILTQPAPSPSAARKFAAV